MSGDWESSELEGDRHGDMAASIMSVWNLNGVQMGPLQVVEEAIGPITAVIGREFESWKTGLSQEFDLYQRRGNTKTELLLTVIVLFVVAFHIELVQLWRFLFSKGGLLHCWRVQWKHYCQQRQRIRRRRERKKIQGRRTDTKGDKHKDKDNSYVNNLASPTSTASTVAAESSMGRSRPLSPIPTHNTSTTRKIMHSNQKQISPRPLRDAYGFASPLPFNNPRPTSPFRTASIGHGSQRSQVSFQSKNNMLDSQDSFDTLHTNSKNYSRLPQTSSLLNSSIGEQNQSNSTIASNNTLSSHTLNTPTLTSRTPSEKSYLSDHSYRAKSRRNHGHNTRHQPPESAPIRRGHTEDFTTRRRHKKKPPGTLGAPLSQARRRMSGGGEQAERAAAAAGPRRAVTSAGRDMGSSHHGRAATARSFPTNYQRSISPGRSPPPTNHRKTATAAPPKRFQMTRELSREDLGYE